MVVNSKLLLLGLLRQSSCKSFSRTHRLSTKINTTRLPKFYMLSISQFIPNLIAKMDSTIEENADIPAIGFGIIGAIILQIIFAHVPLINNIFYTAPLTLNQWLICLVVGSPMILWATWVNRFDPPN
ncbi:cation-translocating P-type ATPase C-terminal domain-containing protein [Microcoleus sp. ZQ-A2]